MIDHPSWRIQQPRTGQGRDIAEEIWKRRHEMTVEADEKAHDAVNITVNHALTMRITDQTHQQFAMATRESWRSKGGCFVQYRHFCHLESDDRARWIAHAWRAAQAARLLRALGEEQAPDDAPLCVLTREAESRLMKLVLRFAPARRPTIDEVLELALDEAVRKRIDALPGTAVTTDRIDIGNGVTVDASLWAPILAVHHPDHGTFSLPGQAARTLNARIDAARTHALADAGGPAERIERLMQICREAIALDPDMSDAAGTPIAPLLDRHLPKLADLRREALSSATSAERQEMEREVEETLALVAGAVEEGMATRARVNRDALRTELHFLSMRHRDQEVGQEKPREGT